MSVPSISSMITDSKEELIVSVSKEGFLVESQYYKQGIPGAYKDCYMRKSLIDMLHKAEGLLLDGLRLMIYDGYRPICIQQH